MKLSVIARTTAVNSAIIAALTGGTGLIMAIAAIQLAHAQTDPTGVDNSAYGELVGERYKNEEAPKGQQRPGPAEKSGADQRNDAKKGSERAKGQYGVNRGDKPAHSPGGDQNRQGN